MKNKQRTTNNKQRTYKAFTLLELAVAVGLLAMMILFASMIFNMSIDTYRMATASAEIMQKLQAITSQLTADFKGLRKDGEIFVVWTTSPAGAGDNDYDHDGFIRFDRIMFFADGDFQSYKTWGTPSAVVHGNLARISYMLAKNGSLDASQQAPEKRILARTQHIITAATSTLPDHGLLNVGSLTADRLRNWHNNYEYDTISLEGWKNIPWQPGKAEILEAITAIRADSSVGEEYRIGATVNPADANSIHMLLCEGVGEFKVQGWYDAQQRWVPEVGNGDFGSLPSGEVPGVLYPYPPYGLVSLGGAFLPGNPFRELLNEAKFDYIPGLGRALKFTFTLYDSKGVIKNGKTFTHIVYLGE